MTVEAPAHLFVHRQGDRIRAAIVVTTRNGGLDGRWVTAAVASCPAAELDPTTPTGALALGRWTDLAGAPVPNSVLAASPDCYGGTQVLFEKRLYVRVPNGGVDAKQLETTWAANVALPASAVATSYRSGDMRLFVAADRRAICRGVAGRGERLPHVIGDEVLRIDCN